MPIERDIFVIGTGPSGMAAARTAKLNAPHLSVTAIRREPSYIPCALPYALGRLCEVDSYLKDESKLLTGAGIEVLEGEVAQLAPREKEVILSDGTAYRYGKLIVATGAEPIELPWLGATNPNVFAVRTPADIHKILDYRLEGMHIAVLGGGYVGVEMACMMRRAGHEVILVEMMDRLMPRSFDAEFSQLACNKLAEGGVAVTLGMKVERAVSAQDGTVRELISGSGRSIRADMIILALGVRPRLRLFKEASIETERDGVVVDEKMRTSAPDVYACGDCTRFRSFITGKVVAGNLATNGVFQGKVAGLNAVGKERRFAGFLNACATEIFGLCFGSVGLTEDEAAKTGMETLSGIGISRNAYPMFKHSCEVKVKLRFERRSRAVVGGQVVGTQGVAERVDLIALAIQQRLEADDLARLAHCAHPTQSGVPAHNPIVMAAEKIE